MAFIKKDIERKLKYGNYNNVEDIITQHLQLRRFEKEENNQFKQLDKFMYEWFGIETNFVYATEQHGLDYTIISDITSTLKKIGNNDYAYIEVFFVFDRKQKEIIITEVILTNE